MSNSFEFAFPSNRVHPKVRLQQKLQRVQMPQPLAAVVAYVLDTEYVQPKISEVAVSADGAVLARVDHEPTFGHFIADYDDLLRGWFALLSSARLTDYERMFADAMFAERIGFYGETQG